jgi:6-phosphogluconolactonase (cycloisomerase 2 family)
MTHVFFTSAQHPSFKCTHSGPACSCTLRHPTHHTGGCQQVESKAAGKTLDTGGDCTDSGKDTPAWTVTSPYGTARVTGHQDGVGAAATFGQRTNGVVYHPVQNYAVMNDEGNHCFRKLDLTTKEATTFAGVCGTNGRVNGAANVATFAYPVNGAFHPDGSYFMVTDLDGEIRKVSLAADQLTATTVATVVAARDGHPDGQATGGIAMAPDGSYILFAEILPTTVGIVWKIDTATWAKTKWHVLQARGGVPRSMRFEKSGRYLWYACNSEWIRKIRMSDKMEFGVVTGYTPSYGRGLLDVAIDDTHDVPQWALTMGNNLIYKLDLTTATPVRTTVAGQNLWGAGEPTTWQDGVGTAAAFWAPSKITLAKGSSSAFITGKNNIIRKMAIPIMSSECLCTAGGAWVGTSATGSACTSAGANICTSCYAADHFFDSIAKLCVPFAQCGGDTPVVVVPGTPTSNVVCGTEQNWKDNAAPWTLTTMFGKARVPGYENGFGTAATFGTSSQGISLHPSKNYGVFADFHNHCFRKLDLTTKEVTTFAGVCGTSGFGPRGCWNCGASTPKVNGAANVATFGNPKRGAFHPDGSYFMVTDLDGEIRKVTLAADQLTATTVDTVVAAAKNQYASGGITMAPDGTYIMFNSQREVWKIDTATWAKTHWHTLMNNAHFIEFEKSGNYLYYGGRAIMMGKVKISDKTEIEIVNDASFFNHGLIGVAFDPTSDVPQWALVPSARDNVVFKCDLTGSLPLNAHSACTKVLGHDSWGNNDTPDQWNDGIGAAASLFKPGSITFDHTGSWALLTGDNDVIRRLKVPAN